MRHVPVVLLVVMLASSPTVADQPARADLEFFEKKIRPLLVDNCYKCHTGPKLKGHLTMDSRAGLLKGGDSGPAIVPGEPAKSLLVKAIGHLDPELRMPPRGKLDDQQIADVVAWIKRGAPWPAANESRSVVKKDFDLEERSRHWSLLPLKTHEPPAVKNQAWVRSPIDAFLLARLEEKGLAPAPPADKRTLIRRVTFDLIGLPPTPDEIETFLSDTSAEAFARVVDRLLASPHYGERWARHWLDLVRYAETQGHEFDFEIADAWRYRDYVIRAFNADVPYHHFVTEHLAGDLLDQPRRHPVARTNESILGTGFWFLGEAKHSPVDVRGDQSDRVDNQIDVFSKTFLAMTVACARCHDHKFDAISTRDYYALAGFLQSSRQQRAFIDDPAPRLQKLRALRALQDKACRLAVAESVAFLKSQKALSTAPLQALLGAGGTANQFASARQAAIERLKAEQARVDAALAGALVFADGRRQGFSDWLATGEAFTEVSKAGTVALDLTTPLTAARVHRANVARSGTVLAALQGALRSPTFLISKQRIHFRAAGKEARVNLILDGLQLIRSPIYGGLTYLVNTKPVVGPAPKDWRPDSSPAVPLESPGAFQWHTMDVSMWLGHRAYIEILDDGPGHVAFDRVVFSDDAPPPEAPNGLLLELLKNPTNDSPERLTQAYLHLAGKIVEQWALDTLDEQPDAAERIDLLNSILATTIPPSAPYAPLVMGKRNEFHKNDAVWVSLEKDYAKIGLPLPPATRALAMTDGTPVNEHVFIRGSHKNAGAVVPRRFLEVFGGAAKPPPEKHSGRPELARDLVNPALTPIVPRVLVNRLWKHHFGEGIVRSPDDFGVLGQAPTHPELLDYLAIEFVNRGWSIKKLHRLLLLSSAYQMASRAPAAADEADPDNKLLHKMPVRRLEAEAIRDAVLAVSGRLDRKMFGPGEPPHLTAFMVGRGRPASSGPLDGNGRRSIYLGVRRNFLNPMFLAFDYPTPFSTMGRRGVSNVPAQALTMMNNPLVLEQASIWAKKTLADKRSSQRDRITGMYVAALGRPPSRLELAEAAAFLEEQARVYEQSDDARAWTDLAHVLFNVKEFIFVN